MSSNETNTAPVYGLSAATVTTNAKASEYFQLLPGAAQSHTGSKIKTESETLTISSQLQVTPQVFYWISV